MRPDTVPGRPEFIAMLAMLFATIAFSIDAMLPALPEIGAELTPDDVNRAQLVVTSFVLGMGIGTFFTGPLSDTFGRKPVVLAGATLYVVMSLVAAQEDSLELLLVARLFQGLGAAGPRVVALAIVRDLHSGREMARIMSFVMMIFTIFPALAPSMGAVIIDLSSWRGIFIAFVVFATISTSWLMLRLPETLPREKRRPFRLRTLWAAVKELLGHTVVRISIAVQALIMAMLFSMISTVQPIYDISYGRAESFPLWFGGVAILAASGSVLNAALVMRLGMRFLVTAVLGLQVVLAGAALVVFATGLPSDLGFAVFVVWQLAVFFQMGLTMGNLNAIAMEPVGHIAGLAASVIGALATVMGVVIAIPTGLMFDGTPLPLAGGIFVEAVLALLLMRKMAKIDQANPV
ncbi:MFS transporter, DHA1 family, bicyclomycin/chloramphenicol resistance protein [Salipiger thiooxidans]|uniref:MFS transporter, DHA1 family, bicyclomycin/chloramphenicol resistance protein n=1 Tax=Salipiger thiooxidans TaxID=282683 RepID=A0A1G7HB45_9RHOB|nr:multidrug effflux MFS transporter [Salipiger thiooxidans]SDE97615.1 MFS transporter, DHA1 family, bicyclomycin/chloramphenicol resistance protein [Salipiger thiooxidans]